MKFRSAKFKARSRWFLPLLLVASLIATGLIGCQSPGTTLTMAISAPEAARWSSLIAAFEAEHPDIQIELVEGPSASDGIEQLYTNAFTQGDNTYDLVYMDLVWVPKYAAAGWLVDLRDRIAADELENFLPGDVLGSTYEAGLYRLPMRSDLGVMLYRQDVLRQLNAAPPDTFDALLQTAQRLQADSDVRWGYAWQGGAYEGLVAMFVEVLAGYGGFWIDPDAQIVGLDQPEALQAVKFLRQSIAQGISPERVTIYGEEETRRLFQDGEVIFLRNWPEVWAIVNSVDSPIQGQIAIHPVPHAPNQQSHGCQGGWGLGIASTTSHPEAAWEAIRFFTSAASQRQFTLESGYLPSRTALYTDPQIVQRYPHYPALLSLFDQSVLRPAIPQYLDVSAILQRYLQAALNSQLSPEQAMQTAAQETRRLLAAPPSP